MNTERLTGLIRDFFLAIAGIGLVLNIVFDFNTFRKNQESDRLGEKVARSFQGLVQLQKINLLSPSYDKFQKELVFSEIDQLKKFELESFDSSTLERLKDSLEMPLQSRKDTADSLEEEVVKEIAKHEEANHFFNADVENEMKKALVFDFFIILVMLTLFILNLVAKRKVEQNLKSSLINMRDSLSALQEKVFSRKVASKMAVHDLKNPIGTIMGFAQLLHEDPKSDSTVMEFSERIRQISERSLVLVESLLLEDDGAQAIKNKIDITPVINDICSQLEIQAAKKGQNIIRDFKIPHAFILADSLKLEEMLSNILSNAIKFSPRGAKIRLNVSECKGSVQIEVEDQGPGFSEQDKKNAFQFGKKLSAVPTANESSTGYGLYIVKQIVEAFDGEVELLDAHSGSGTRFQVRFPLLV